MTGPQSISPDIVEALRGLADTLMNGSGKTVEISYADIRHAADEIERLRASLQPATPTAGAVERCAICGERDYPTRQSRCEHPNCPPIPATASDAVAGEAKAIGWISEAGLHTLQNDNDATICCDNSPGGFNIPVFLRSTSEAATTREPFVVSDDDWQRALDCAMSCLRPEWTKASDISRIEMDNAMQHAFGILSLAYEGRRDALAQPSWQPIETAPKDGTEIWLFGPAPEGPRITIGHWSQEEECRAVIGDCGGECRCPEYDYCEPSWMSADGGFSKEWPCTLWQPLPTPALPSTENKTP